MATIRGRAEHEDISSSKLFESEPPDGEDHFTAKDIVSGMYPFAAKGKGVGMIVGDRGYGKTFFARKLAEELSGKIYSLDKQTLEYHLSDDCQNPRFIAVDDLHYQMRAMKLNDLIGKPVDENKILERLYGFKEEAQALDVPLIFISDDGPAGLYIRFKDEANQKRFLELLEGCVASDDDTHRFHQYLGKYYTPKRAGELNNVLKFRKWIDGNLTIKIKKNLKMTDVPLIIPEKFLRSQRYGPSSDLVVGVKPGDFDRLLSDESNDDFRELARLETPSLTDLYLRCLLIRPIRELKVISDALGNISRKTLGVKFGNAVWGAVYYSPGEIRELSKLIGKKYDALAEKIYLPLAKALLSTDDDEQMRAFLIEHNLAQD